MGCLKVAYSLDLFSAPIKDFPSRHVYPPYRAAYAGNRPMERSQP